ncbi:hypothetical protein, partial [Pseudonocardia sp. McavD-2-B]|uniref:hypothetical protein n=1 Tax=Pseudonocardia sp. McavD-2-B TaxID=2954499 RepID=UPI0020979D30
LEESLTGFTVSVAGVVGTTAIVSASTSATAHTAAVTNVVALAGEPGTGESTDPGLGELRPVRTGRHAPR